MAGTRTQSSALTPPADRAGGGPTTPNVDARQRAEELLQRAAARAEAQRQARLEARREDDVLVAKAQAGDAQAFRRLVERVQGRLFAVALGMLKDRDDAADAVQDALIKAHRSLASFERNAAFSTWVHRICVNVCIDKQRSAARRRAVALSDVHEGALGDVGAFADIDVGPGMAETNPLRNVANQELSQAISAAMVGLSDDHRSVLMLREIEGLSYEEIAEVLDIPKGTVMSRLFHARRNLQVRLTPYLEAAGMPVPGDGSGEP